MSTEEDKKSWVIKVHIEHWEQVIRQSVSDIEFALGQIKDQVTKLQDLKSNQLK